MRAHRHKKQEEAKGFNLLEASYAEKGLISTGDSSHLISAKAVGDTHAHSERHHLKEKGRRASFVESAKEHKHLVRAQFLQPRSEKKAEKPAKRPLQMKKPDVEDPEKGKKR